MTELIWEGKYKDGKRVAPVRIALPFQTVETVNESGQVRAHNLDLWTQGQPTEWRNRLIWGDKKYVLPSLLPEFAGKVNLIYIDPPFATGADFSFTATIPEADESFTKEPSMIEQKAYRDTWGRGLDSYLQWFYETVVLLRELLAEDGSLYVHLDSHVSHYGKAVLDEVFGLDNFRNEIVWKRSSAHSDWSQGAQHLGRAHDALLLYTRSSASQFNPVYAPYTESYIRENYRRQDEDGRLYRIDNIQGPGGAAKGNPQYEFLGVTRYWRYSRDTMERLFQEGRIIQTRPGAVPQYKRYLDEMPGVPVQSVWDDISLNNRSTEYLGYPTQKPEALLERIISLSCNEGDLVLDCFCGSGTTAAVAEKLGRRWITCDLGRFAIHTTRKRLLSIENVKPFVVQNLGKYERQTWQVAEFAEGDHTQAPAAQLAYRRFMLDLYRAQPIEGYTWLHGLRDGRLVHVGSVDSPVAVGDVQQIVREFWKVSSPPSPLPLRGEGEPEQARSTPPIPPSPLASQGEPEQARFAPSTPLSPLSPQGEGPGVRTPRTNGVDVLGWDFAFELNEVAAQMAAKANVHLKFKRVPREVLEKKAVEQGDIKFFELAALSAKIAQRDREGVSGVEQARGPAVTITLTDFVVPPDDIPEDVQQAVKHWSQWIDYWAVDWDYKGDAFHNMAQTYRTRKDPQLQTSLAHTYEQPGSYTIVVKVIDILGNDTTKTLKVRVG